MEFKELKNKEEKELQKILSQTREKLRDLRFKDANKQLKNIREIRKTRETIARVLTLLNKLRLGKGKLN
ncbi:MAG: 50S ribosomal protein L29 [Patescibacteria group bacterium]|nr:50S ribosomal protein L29 [Patescibacteria group bacterium]